MSIKKHAYTEEGYAKKPFVIEDGYIPVSEEPGLGMEPDDDAIADKVYDGS
jgi:galactonate dehydratase